MKSRSRALGLIDRDLMQARRILDGVARRIRDASFAPKRNIFRIGHALVDIFDIQEEIYRERPDLIPEYLRGTDHEKRMLSNKGRDRPAAKGRVSRTATPRGGGRPTATR